MNKYTFRRFIASIITIPVAIAGHFLLWAGLIALGAYGTMEAFMSNVPITSIVWVLMWTFWPDYERYLERKDAERE